MSLRLDKIKVELEHHFTCVGKEKGERIVGEGLRFQITDNPEGIWVNSNITKDLGSLLVGNDPADTLMQRQRTMVQRHLQCVYRAKSWRHPLLWEDSSTNDSPFLQ